MLQNSRLIEFSTESDLYRADYNGHISNDSNRKLTDILMHRSR